MNPNIFKLDYNKIKKSNLNINKEIIEKALSPKRVSKWIDEDFDF
jgi:hypothetical protein